jgi:hypothetical protein
METELGTTTELKTMENLEIYEIRIRQGTRI